MTGGRGWQPPHNPTSLAECHPGTSHQMGQNRKFWLGESISLRTFTPVVSLRTFYPFWAQHGRKLRIGLFDRRATNWCFCPACDQNQGLVLLRCDRGSNSQNFDLKRLLTFTSMVPKVSLEDFVPILGAPWPKTTNRSFWPACDQMVLLTSVRPKPGLGPFVVGQIFEILTWRDFGPLRQWSRKLTSRIFYPFCAPHGQKLRIVLFDRRATTTWVWSFWGATMGQIFKILSWRDFGPLC